MTDTTLWKQLIIKKQQPKKRLNLKSQFEKLTLDRFRKLKVKVRYEPLLVPYQIQAMYNPDWVLPNGVIIETKGNFDASDRSKHLKVQEQYPWLDIRFVFQRDNKIYRKSVTRYSDWCKQHGFKFSIGRVPVSWVRETKKSPEYMRAIGAEQ